MLPDAAERHRAACERTMELALTLVLRLHAGDHPAELREQSLHVASVLRPLAEAIRDALHSKGSKG